MFLLLWPGKVFVFFSPAVFQDAMTSFLAVENPLRQWQLERLWTARKRGPRIRQADMVPLTPHLPHGAPGAAPGGSGPAVLWAIPGGPPSLETPFQFRVQQLHGFVVLNPFMLKIVVVSFIPCNLILTHPEVGSKVVIGNRPWGTEMVRWSVSGIWGQWGFSHRDRNWTCVADSRKSYINSQPKCPGVKSLLKARHGWTKRLLQPRGKMRSIRWMGGLAAHG